MDALGIVYPQYRMQPKLEKRLNTHLVIIKATFCQPKKVGPMKYGFLACSQLLFLTFSMTNNVQLSMQKPFDVNLVTKLWRTFTSF
jgi:hypothetical protein